MIITINIDTASLTPTELGVLRALGPADPTEPAVAKAKAAAPAPKAVKAVEQPEPIEDLVGTDDAPTLDDAVARATALVSEGKAAAVKAALATAGAKRVSELKPATIKVFLDALDG